MILIEDSLKFFLWWPMARDQNKNVQRSYLKISWRRALTLSSTMIYIRAEIIRVTSLGTYHLVRWGRDAGGIIITDYITARFASCIYLQIKCFFFSFWSPWSNVFIKQQTTSVRLKEEWDTSIMWRTFFRNKQWKWLFINRSYLYKIK